MCTIDQLELVMPRYAIRGGNVILKCEHSVIPEQLYKVEWQKAGNKIFQYIKGRKPPFRYFQTAGAELNLHSCAITDENVFIFNDAVAFLSMLNSSTNSAINSYVPRVLDLPADLQTKSAAALEPVQAQVQAAYSEIQILLRELQQRYEDAGQDITQCLNIYVPELEVLPRLVLREIEACLQRTVDMGVEFARLTVEQIESTRTEISRMRLRIDECISLPDGTDCIILVRSELSGLVVVVPRSIQEDAERAQVLIAALENQFPVCYADRVNSVNEVGRSTLEHLETCATPP